MFILIKKKSKRFSSLNSKISHLFLTSLLSVFILAVGIQFATQHNQGFTEPILRTVSTESQENESKADLDMNKNLTSSMFKSSRLDSGSASQTSGLSSSNKGFGDFNGDGKGDLAIGVFGESINNVDFAGAVNIIYGDNNGLDPKVGDQFITQGSLVGAAADAAMDSFGNALAVGDFDGDGKDDLAIGVPGDHIGSISPGSVYVVYGTALGLAGDEDPKISTQIFSQGSLGIDDAKEDLDEFGHSLTSGDFNSDGKDDLAIGVPKESLGSLRDAGGVEVIYGSSSGLSAISPVADQFWTQESPDVDDMAEATDIFGWSLTSGDFNGDGKDDLAIGVESETVLASAAEGAVEVIYGSSSGLSALSPRVDQFWSQESPNVNEVAEETDAFGSSLTSGDFNGDGKDDLAIGVPFESVGSIIEAGGVEVIYGSSSGLSPTLVKPDQFWTQQSPDVNDVAEVTDEFSHSLTSGDFNADGKDDLAIGILGESVGTISDAGSVEVIYGSSSGLSALSPRVDQFWTQESTNVNDVAEANDQFGHSLTSGDFNADGKNDLAIGVPGEEEVSTVPRAGAVEVIYGSSLGLSATSVIADQFWTQNSTSVKDSSEDFDNFGSSLG
jgi:hypothetical protein